MLRSPRKYGDHDGLGLDRQSLSYREFDKTAGFSVRFCPWKACLIFRELRVTQVFEKLVAILSGKANEKTELLQLTRIQK
jgi:hypothetical protein